MVSHHLEVLVDAGRPSRHARGVRAYHARLPGRWTHWSGCSARWHGRRWAVAVHLLATHRRPPAAVGYGDLHPVIRLGRLVAVSLTVVGVSLVGLVTATVASWSIAQGEQRSEAETEELSARLRRLEDELDRLLAERERTPGPR